MGKEAIKYGESAYDIIKFNYFIGIRIWRGILFKYNRNIKINMIEKIVIYGPSFPRTWALNSASHNVPSAT